MKSSATNSLPHSRRFDRVEILHRLRAVESGEMTLYERELEEQLVAFREFFDAHWMVEKGVTDFDLHGEAVERLHRAFNAVYAFHSPDSIPAKRSNEKHAST